MTNKIYILAIIALTSLFPTLSSASTMENISKVTQEKAGVIYFVRHAQKIKNVDNPDLTAEGKKRAQELAKYLKDANIKGIYVTNFLRTQNTAKPLANKLGLDIKTYDKKNTSALMKVLLERGGNHLVVGHWNTANNAFKYFNLAATYDTEKANNNTSVLKITYKENKMSNVVLLKY